MNANRLQNRWNQVREDVRRHWIKSTNNDGGRIRAEVIRLIDDLQGKYRDVMQQVKQKVDRRHNDRRESVGRFTRRVDGLGSAPAVVVVTLSRER